MVCDNCQERIRKLAVPDVTKKNDKHNGNNTVAGGGVKAGEECLTDMIMFIQVVFYVLTVTIVRSVDMIYYLS